MEKRKTVMSWCDDCKNNYSECERAEFIAHQWMNPNGHPEDMLNKMLTSYRASKPLCFNTESVSDIAKRPDGEIKNSLIDWCTQCKKFVSCSGCNYTTVTTADTGERRVRVVGVYQPDNFEGE
jgi:hypothetical protein